MICTKCKAKWEMGTSSDVLTKCPFCGAPLFEENRDAAQQGMDEIVSRIVSMYGENILTERNRFLSLFSDLAPAMTTEKNMLMLALNMHIPSYFIGCAENERERSVRLARRELGSLLTESAADAVTECFISVFGWDEELLSAAYKTDAPAPAAQPASHIPKVPPAPRERHAADSAPQKESAPENIAERVEKLMSVISEGSGAKETQRAFDELYELAKRGEACAQSYVAECMYYGDCTPENKEGALYWYKKAAEQGDADAQYSLGFLYENGEGIEADAEKAAYWYGRAAALGNTDAAEALAFMEDDDADGDDEEDLWGDADNAPPPDDEEDKHDTYDDDDMYDDEMDETLARRLLGIFRSSDDADGDEEESAEQLYSVIEGKAGRREKKRCISRLTQLAMHGDADAQYYMGECYYYGEGFPENKESAVIWYKKAALQDHPDAQYSMGVCCEIGEGMPYPSPRDAFYWYEKSAVQGNEDAQCSLGWCYESGIGTDKDMRRAFYWYEKSAKQHNPEAQYALASCYENGIGVKKDKEMAVYWYRQSAENGYEHAYDILDDMGLL